MGLAPAPRFPEQTPNTYEEKFGPNQPGNRGPLRFEEGMATDTDVPSDFQRGMMEGQISAPGHYNHVNPDVQYKHANETMAERAHVGSASWVDSPPHLAEFAHGAHTELAEVRYEMVQRSGGRYELEPPNAVRD
jgi:hypothetical protein